MVERLLELGNPHPVGMVQARSRRRCSSRQQLQLRDTPCLERDSRAVWIVQLRRWWCGICMERLELVMLDQCDANPHLPVRAIQ
jgi:hypothetical protein